MPNALRLSLDRRFPTELTFGAGNLVNTFEGEDPEGRDALLCDKKSSDWRARDENDLHYWTGSKDL
jgi:hypothetical protein